ncbi:uncharacterized protein [Dysidea avara]|uniref:uncharacterized protein isoform X3 n=1 Tax=Dysidea avara TaxID=196820 RepID=UPI00332A11CE
MDACVPVLSGVEFDRSVNVLRGGGYGTVYKVQYNGTFYAAKEMRHSGAISANNNAQNEQQIFQQECILHNKLRHVNVVEMLGICYHGDDPHEPLLVMELLERSLSSLLVQYQTIPKFVKLSILQDISRGLQYLHTQNPPIVHCNIHGSNIFLTSNLTAKIGDADSFFDVVPPTLLARENEDLLPPEVLSDTPCYSLALDVFSFGCVVCHVMTQQWPKPRPTAEVLNQPIDRAFILLEVERRQCFVDQINEDSLEQLVVACLDEKAQDRPAISVAYETITGIITDQHAGDDSIKMAYSLAIKQGQAQSRDLQVLLVGTENTGKTCLVASFLGEEFVEGQAATEGADVDVCKIYCRDWKRISHFERSSYLNCQFIEQFKGVTLNNLLPSKSDSPAISNASALGSAITMASPHTGTLPSAASDTCTFHSPGDQEVFSDLKHYNSESLNGILWDFSGQVISHNTHSVFISEKGVPVITFNASMDLMAAVTPREGSPIPHECPTIMSSIHYYLQVVDSVCSVRGGKDDLSPLLPTAVLAGTHIDKLHPDIKVARKIAKEKHLTVLEEELIGKSYARHLAGCKKNLKTAVTKFCFFVSNKCRDEEVEHLKNATKEAATSLKKMQPIFFLQIECALLTHKQQIISKSMLVDIIAENAFPIPENSPEFDGIVKYFHGKRTILHFSQASNLVILSPQWLAKLFSYVITAHSYSPQASDLDDDWKRLTEYGILHQSLLQHMLDKFHSDYPSEVGVTYKQVVDILLSFHLLVCITREAWFREEDCPSLPEGGDTFIVPSLFRQDDKKTPPQTENEKLIYYRFPAHFIPNSCLNQLIARCICRNVQKGHKLLWMRRGKVGLQLGSHQKYYISRCEEKHSIQLTITVVGDDVTSVQERRELIDDVTELLDDIMKVFFPAAKTPATFLPCPLCPNIHIALGEVFGGETIYCPHRNDDIVPYHHYSHLAFTEPEYINDFSTHTTSSVNLEYTALKENYAKLVMVLGNTSLFHYFVSHRVITVEEEEEILSSAYSKTSQVGVLLLRRIVSPTECGIVRPFYAMLNIMEDYGGVECEHLALHIRQVVMDRKTQMQFKESAIEVFDPVATKETLISQYDSLAALRIDSMLDTLFAKRVVTVKEKQNIEHAQKQNMEGMKWFLDNVIIASLDQGMSEKFKGFIEVMENHDDPLLRKKAEDLCGSRSIS